jgi:hypothetical protein
MLTILVEIKPNSIRKTNIYLLAFNSAFNILQISVGILNNENCPIQPMIPYWLIIMGTASLFLSLTKLLSNFKIIFQSNQFIMNKTLQNQKPIIFDIVINDFYFLLTIFILFFWFIIGNLWIYSKFSEVTFNKIAESKHNYCDHTTYWLSFWTVTIINIFIAYFIV